MIREYVQVITHHHDISQQNDERPHLPLLTNLQSLKPGSAPHGSLEEDSLRMCGDKVC